MCYDDLDRLISVSEAFDGASTAYRYDPLDALTSQGTGADEQQRFYQQGDIHNLKQGANSTTFVHGEGIVLAERQAGADPKSLLLASDDKNSVLCEVEGVSANDLVYSPYGHRGSKQPVRTALGYNGEVRETQTDWYILGRGYRAFSPLLMRFLRPDRLSPFEEGGMNAYVYCEGDPVNNTDPDGHAMFGRIFGKTIKTDAVSSDIPKFLLQNSKGRPTTVYKIKPKHQEQLKKTSELRAWEYKQAKRDIKRFADNPELVREYNNAGGNFMRDANSTLYNTKRASDEADAAYRFALDNPGARAITRETKGKIEASAKEYTKVVAGIREAGNVKYELYRQDMMYRKNQEDAENFFKRDPVRNFLGSDNTYVRYP